MDPSVKKILNNGTLIRRLAPMMGTPAATELARAAQLYADLLSDFGIEPSFEGFDGCDEAKTLVKWLRTGSAGDAIHAIQMGEWTATIWSAIADLVAGKLPV